MLVISPERRFIFVHVPKTAGTSISALLEPYGVFPAPNLRRRLARRLRLPAEASDAYFRTHDTVGDLIARLGRAHFNEFLSFAVVREPFSHAVSHYRYLRRHPHQRIRLHFEKASFREYLEFRVRPPRFHRLPRFAAMGDQAGFLTDGAGNVAVRELLRFETLAEDLGRLLPSLGIETDGLPHARAAPGSNDATGIWTERCRELVRQLYARDFELFGYCQDTPGGPFARRPKFTV